ncbi:MAG: type II toxin-antitoxin system HicB family antitoxin [SAR202 cluster bacterium]|nr:type II toxin-antitoxin system HicB family antitoxin [SAR202 cluster bacterium]
MGWVQKERNEDGTLVGTVPFSHGCHTEAGTMDELIERMKEVILLCLDAGVAGWSHE